MKKQRQKGQKQFKKPQIYGFHAVLEALKNPSRKIEALYGTQEALAKIDAAGVMGAVVTKADLERMLPKGAVHQGLALVCSDLPEIGLQDLIIKAETKERSLILILDQITDPQNVGAIIRSACAFGADGVVMQRKHAPELTGSLAKAACGGVEHVDVAYETNLSRSIEALQEGGFTVYGLDERGEVEIQEANFSGKTAMVLGAEGPGIRRLVKENCDQLLRIPMTNAIASINVSNAAATALFAWSIQH